MKYLLPYWRRYRFRFFFAVFFVFIEAVGELMQPRIMSVLIDDGALAGSLPTVGRYALIMLGVLAVGAGAALVRNYLASVVSQQFSRDLRLDMFKKIQSLPADEIDRFEGGSLITRMTNDVMQLQNFSNGMMRVFVRAPFVCIGAIVMSATLNVRTMFVIIPVIVVVFFTLLISMKMAYPRFAKMQRRLDTLNTTMREYLAGIRLVKAFRRFDEEEKRFSKANDALMDETVGANNVLAIFSPFLALFVNIGITGILLLGSIWVDTGDMQIGQIMAFVSYLTQILMSLTLIANLLNMFVRVRASNERIAEVFDSDAEEPGTRREPTRTTGAFDELRFDNVYFRYRGSTGDMALSGISFSIKRGETLGVIGPTGSGKSTLAALAMRFYEPTEGAITLNGIPLSDVDEGILRGIVAIVPQTPALFTGTIRDNLLWGKEDATEAELRRAAEAAEALRFIEESKDGFNRVVGQSGVNLSGGQKQRVSIARALIREPEFLILDDCTSALDLVTEARVKQALFDMRMTTMFITQRISTVSRCDKILVLDAGTQAGFGTHEELMENCAVYYDIYVSQIGSD
ncbi:MAG: ABC transporter ATP-binding protein/permease [Oscillospiraceae bacterium]|nr:ABC transporter ATP-binding protein/permease [Oscillospiraceae bacterium]